MGLVNLIRLECNETETIGVLMIAGRATCYTLELPWRSNRHNISCVPTGTFHSYLTISPNHGKTYEVEVPEREDILFHVGNTYHDTQGCILPGLETGKVGENRAILHSKLAMAKFLEELKDVTAFTITISNFG